MRADDFLDGKLTLTSKADDFLDRKSPESPSLPVVTEPTSKSQKPLKEQLYSTLNKIFQPGNNTDPNDLGVMRDIPSAFNMESANELERVRANAPSSAYALGAAPVKLSAPVLGLRQGIGNLAQSAAGAIEAAGDITGIDRLSTYGSQSGGRIRDFTQGAVLDKQPIEGFTPNSIIQDLPQAGASAVSSVIANAPALAISAATGNPTLGLMQMFGQSSANQYSDARNSGVTGGGAAINALLTGAAEVAGEKVGGFGILSKGIGDAVKGQSIEPLARAMIKSGIRETPGEELTTALQFGIDKLPGVGTNQEATGADLAKQMKDTALATLMQSGGMVAGGQALSAASQAQNPNKQIAKAINEAVDKAEYAIPAEQVARASLAPNESQALNIISPLPKPKPRTPIEAADDFLDAPAKEPANDLPTTAELPVVQPVTVQGNESVAAPVQNESRIAIPDPATPSIEQPTALTQETPATARTASWVIRDKATGDVVMETYDPKKVEALNTVKYEAVPIAEHLNSLSKADTWEAAKTAKADPIVAPTVTAPEMAAEVDRPFELPEQITERSTQLETASEGLRPGDIVAATGKPFATKAAADKEKKLAGKGWQVKKGAGGFVIRHQPQTEAQIAAHGRRKRNANQVDTESDSMFAAIAKLGGIRMDDLTKQWGFDPSEFKSLRGAGIKRVGTANGMSLDRAGEALAELGYLSYDENGKHDLSELFDLFDGELRGNKHFTPQGYAKVGQAMNEQGWLDAQLAEQLDALPEDGQDNIEEFTDEYETVSEPEEAAITIDSDDASASMGGENGEVNNDASAEEGNNRSVTQATEGAPPASAASQRAGDDGESTGRVRSESVDDFALDGETEQEAQSRIDRQAQARQRDEADARKSDQRTQADAERGSFTLTGSDRTADVAASQGQEDIFGSNTSNDPDSDIPFDANDSRVDRNDDPDYVPFSRADDTRDLMFTHNLTGANLLHANRMGGIAVPSFAITKKSNALDGFGEITLIGSRNMADPKGYAGTKVFGADIYSPRYPSVNHKFDRDALESINQALKPYTERYGNRDLYPTDLDNDAVRELAGMNSVRAAALDSMGIVVDPVMENGAVDKYKTERAIANAISENQAYKQVDQFAKDLVLNSGAEERIFQGYTNAGKRKYTPHTLENVVKILKKELRAGENFSYGVGSIRATVTPQFRSIAEIKKNKGRIVGEESFGAVKKEIDDELNSITRSLESYHPASDRFGFSDTVTGTMSDAAKMGVPRALNENGFEDVPLELQRQVSDFMQKLRELPTGYFEAKILRDVSLSEFSGAVIPSDTSKAVREALDKAGVPYREYSNDDSEQGRIEARRKAVEEYTTELDSQGKDTLFQRNGKQTGLSVDAVRAAIAKDSFNHDVDVYATLDDAPEYIRIQARREGGGDVEGYWDMAKNKVALIASNLDSPERAREVARHELIGHYGLENMLSDSADPGAMNALVKRVIRAEQDGNKLIQELGAQVDRSQPDIDEKRRAKEIIAIMAERNIQNSITRRVYDAIRTFLKKIGFIDSDITDAEIAGLLRDAQNYLRQQGREMQYGQPAGAFAREQKTPLESGTPLTREEVLAKQSADERAAKAEAKTDKPKEKNVTADQVDMFNEQGSLFARTSAEMDQMATSAPRIARSQHALNFGTRATFDSPEPGTLDAVVRAMQNNKIDLKRVQDAIRETGATITEGQDAYLNEELYIGKVTAMIDKLVDRRVTPMLEAINKAGLTVADVSEYLYARHVSLDDVNTKLRALNADQPNNTALSGMTDAKAAAIMGKYRGNGDMTRIAGMVDNITTETRRRIVSSGLETAEMVRQWESTYKHYVPLMRDVEGGRQGTGQGYAVKGKESQRRMGSDKEATNILANIIAQAQSSIMRSEKAKVGRSLLDLARNHPNDAFWKVDMPPQKKTVSKETGLVEVAVDPRYKVADNVLVVKENGIEHFIVFNEKNARAVEIAKAMKNLDMPTLPWVIESTGKLTRHLAQWITARNPLFWITNFARDVQGAAFNLQDTPIAGKEAQVMKNIPSAMRGYWKITRGDGEGKWADYANEFKSAGAETGYVKVFESPEDHMADLEKQLAQMQQGKADPRKLARSMIEAIDDYNTIIENGVRLAVYQAGRDNGMTIRKSASMAKNITVNFNRRGNQSTGFNALYMFMNASIQGNTRFLTAIATNRRAQTVAAALVGIGFVLDAVNRAIGGDDDETGRKKYDLIPEWERERNWIFMSPSGKYIKVPMPYGPHIALNMGRMMSDMVFGAKADPVERALSIARITVDAFNPLGSNGSFNQLITPSVLKPVTQISENKSFTGAPLYREADDRGHIGPAYTRHFRATAEHWVEASKMLNDVSGGDTIKPGSVDIPPEVLRTIFLSWAVPGLSQTADKSIDTATRSATGKRVEPSQIPALSRFYGEAPEERALERAYYEDQRKVKQALEQAKKYSKVGDRASEERTLTELGEGDLKKGKAVRRKWEKAEEDMQYENKERRRLETDKTDDADQRSKFENIEKRRLEIIRKALR
ncbi:Hypothetical protein HEAR2267 [Herminiimonas arsenicoxydans]|uniref:Uncharacterized protein n=1 Tax=Herminiimonas arsenicoxydans TaxID=204773 RepID=A4G7B3_HERAR|nr:Hypothetical protein HEAR2267 [Herminiimonas arsenicoxydans]